MASRSTLAAYRRSFMRARGIHKQLGEGSIGFTLKLTEGTTSAELRLPNDKVYQRFVVAMKPLLSRESPINLWAIWETLSAHPQTKLQAEEIADVEEAFRELERGPIAFRFDATDASQRDLYEQVGTGFYFEDRLPDAAALREIAGTPFMKVIWYTFFSFCEAAYPLARWLFEKASAIEEPEPVRGPGSCVFCRKDDGGFISEEHIFAESLAGDGDLLPPGHVCDRCNNGPLSAIDEALADFGPVAFFRTLLVPLTKKGKFPRAQMGSLLVEKKAPRRLVVSRTDGRDPFENVRIDSEGQTHFSLKGGTRPDWRQIARALTKIGLEYLVLDEGHERACAPEFDAVRRFVLEDTEFRGYLAIRTNETEPNDEVRATIMPGAGEYGVEIVIFGIPFCVLLREIDMTLPVPEEVLAAAGVVLIPLCGEPRPIGAVRA